jgi:polysaccharide biosynthesis/export protein
MRFSAMKELVERRVREETIGLQVAVSMGELRSIEVFVIGEVQRPGLHQVSGLSTILSALYEAEGITRVGSLRDVRVVRGGETVGQFDLYDLLLDGDPSGDLRLQSGDVVFVPAARARAGVIGETRRPAWYEIGRGADLGRVLAYAGGADTEADLRQVQIQRPNRDGELEVIDVDATTDRGRATRVGDGDLIVIPRISLTAENAVMLRGHFLTPGMRAWREGLRVRDLIPSRAALQDDPDLDYGLVVRA